MEFDYARLFLLYSRLEKLCGQGTFYPTQETANRVAIENCENETQGNLCIIVIY